MHTIQFGEKLWVDMNVEYHNLPPSLKAGQSADRWLTRLKKLGLPYCFCRVTVYGKIAEELSMKSAFKKSVWVPVDDWKQLLDGKPLSKEVSNVPGLISCDGFVNANKLLSLAYKQLHHVVNSNPYKKARDLLQAELEVDVSGVLRVVDDELLWHPRLADWVAFHVDTGFAIKATKWIDQAKLLLPGVAQEHQSALNDISADGWRSPGCVLETTIRDRLWESVGGKKEAMACQGFSDLVTCDEIIEVKKIRARISPYQAIGQVTAYASSYPTLKKRVHLFGSRKRVEFSMKCEDLSRFAAHNAVTLTFEIEEEENEEASEGEDQ